MRVIEFISKCILTFSIPPEPVFTQWVNWIYGVFHEKLYRMCLKHLTFHTVFFLQFHAIFIAKDIMSENNAQKMLSVIENNFHGYPYHF